MAEPTSQPRIFVQIASYRDGECHHTIRDLFERAKHPGRIFIGVCWQYDPKEDARFLSVPYPRPEQVRVIQYHIRDAQGAGWARAQAQGLWQGEEYTLQIQAHHRFEQGWDEMLIALLAACPSQKPALTAWLPGYVPPEEKLPLNDMLPLSTVNRIGPGDDPQMVHLIKRMLPAKALEGRHLPTPMWVGNFLFARSTLFNEVAFDPHIYFWGEEINFSARLWTHGYDLFHLNRLVLYHYWDRVDAKDAASYRDFSNPRNRRSLMRNRHLFGMGEANDAEALRDIDKYPLGKARSLAGFWDYLGVDLQKGTIAKHAKEGKWGKQPEAIGAAPAARIFVAVAAYRDAECTPTIADMFAKAANPDRITVGVCLQYDPKEDAHCAITSDRMGQIRLHTVDYRESKGANWARKMAASLHQGEDYILQIDSHMRFESGWDDLLIGMVSRAPSAKPVITGYLPNYEPPNLRDYSHGHLLRIRVRKFGGGSDPQLVHVTGGFVPLHESERAGLYPTPFFIANFMFARAALLQEVPIDPHFQFYGDEISYAARLWTHGWDMFQPDRVVMFHHWVRKETLHQQHYRDTRTLQAQRSFMRGRHLLGFEEASDPLAIVEIEQYGLGNTRALTDLWAFAGLDWNAMQVTPAALEGKWNMEARKAGIEAAGGALPSQEITIFVQIASYRDPDCQNTLRDLFEKASYPDRVSVGLCWQAAAGDDDKNIRLPTIRPQQVRVREVPAQESRGACWARSETQKLWQGEAFTLQIDSHMRFEQGWDELLLDTWRACENPKAVLSSYPPGFTPPEDCQRDWIFGMSAKEFDRHGILLMKGMPSFKRSHFPAKPMQGAFVSAGMLFAPASIISDVPYDPHLYFFGEEISLAARLWTSGYDIYHPNRPIIYHDWDRHKRATHFSDHRDWEMRNERAFARVRHLLGTEVCNDTEALFELAYYGLGKKRSLAEYEAFSGVNFAAKTFTQEAASGEFGRSIAQAREYKPRIFVQIASYRDRECQWTVKDLFEKATYPDRVFVGICWQFDPEEDQDCFTVSTRPEQVRVMPVDWREGEGVCWARNLTQQLWENEEYSLQIDSHMRFVQGWDELMIAELAACESAKPLLTCSPASYTPPDHLEPHPYPTIRRVTPFFPDGNIRGKGEAIHRSPPKPLNGAFVAGGFVFARSNIITEVPYDPYLYFDQEEITYAARLYTYGWDVFSTRRPLLYHFYNVNGRDSARPLHWQDLRKQNEDKIRRLRERGLMRFNHLTGHRMSTDLESIRELAKYGFGKARSFEQFEAYCGIDFKRKVASQRALRCEFIKDLGLYRDTPIHIPELDGTMTKPMQTGSKPLSPLEPGDFLPLIRVMDTNLKQSSLETRGGKHGLLVYLPAKKTQFVSNFFHQLHEHFSRGKKLDMWLIFILDDTKEHLVALKEKLAAPYVLSEDPQRLIAQALGIIPGSDGDIPPIGYVVDTNLRITHAHKAMSASQLAEALVRDLRNEIGDYEKRNIPQRVVNAAPPALIIPNAFSKELCERCIQAFRSGHTFEGTVGAEAKRAYVPNAKIRTDYVVHGELLREIDDKLSRSVFPEIKKVFGFEVAHREYYKIGAYEAEKGGFFRHHRDNFDESMGYRRLAMTLQLNDDYEGGGLHFPEYDEHIYRPDAGSAIAFSCATMHEALPVTKGERIVLVCFFHSAQDEAYRQHYLAQKNSPSKEADFIPALRPLPEGLSVSRDFYDKWQHQHNASPSAAKAVIPMATSSAKSYKATAKGSDGPVKVFASSQAVIFDNFLPEDVYERVLAFALKTDYEHINGKGKISRAWHVHDGFPLRSLFNEYYFAEGVQKAQSPFTYPTKTDMDAFIDRLLAIQPEVENIIGKQGRDWAHLTATCWIYPPGTGLSMHNDGSGVYSGAYVYFLNPQWRAHWGGLLLLADEESNRAIGEYTGAQDGVDFHQRKWLHANPLDEMLMEHGFAQCIFPKKNRIVFIANEAYHMVTRVNEAAGDNHRMSIAGFFNRNKKPQ